VGTRNRAWKDDVTPELRDHLVSYYDFEHPFPVVEHDDIEADQGSSETLFNLVNGRKEMRVRDGAFPGSNSSIQTQQVNPTVAGNDDWKAGVWNANGVPSLDAFRGVEQVTVMGWFKMTGTNPSLNSNTPDPDDRYNAVGLAGILSGNSDGHGVRALLELIHVDGELRLVALGRRIDTGASATYAASRDWQELLPQGEWVHLAATFDYTTGEMALYRNGRPLDGFYTSDGDPWQVDGTGTSDTLPRGYKIGGSYPQNNREQNPCNCRFDSLMFLDHAATPQEVSVGELMSRGYYLGSNVSYNLKKLVEGGYVHHQRSTVDRRSVRISLTPKGHEVRDIVDGLYKRHLYSIEKVGGLGSQDFTTLNRSLQRLERFWTDQILYRL
jgi:DNA-binding MarR family transcriptional regulator